MLMDDYGNEIAVGARNWGGLADFLADALFDFYTPSKWDK